MAEGTLEFDGVRYLDGQASDPLKLGWMEGTPPPPDKQVRFADDRFLEFPQIRWSLSHMRELVPTVNVWRGPARPAPSALPATWPRPRSTSWPSPTCRAARALGRVAARHLHRRHPGAAPRPPDLRTLFRRAAGARAAQLLLQVLRRDAALARARGHAGRTPAHPALAAGDEGHGLRGRHAAAVDGHADRRRLLRGLRDPRRRSGIIARRRPASAPRGYMAARKASTSTCRRCAPKAGTARPSRTRRSTPS